jgi:hypothetical protein
LDEVGQAMLELGALEEDAPSTADAAEADVGTESDDRPLARAARMRLPQAEDVTEAQLEDRSLHRVARSLSARSCQ